MFSDAKQAQAESFAARAALEICAHHAHGQRLDEVLQVRDHANRNRRVFIRSAGDGGFHDS